MKKLLAIIGVLCIFAMPAAFAQEEGGSASTDPNAMASSMEKAPEGGAESPKPASTKSKRKHSKSKKKKHKKKTQS